MTDLARVENTSADLAQTTGTGQMSSTRKSLREWAGDLEDAYKIAKAVCTTPFAPKDFQGKPESAAAAILKGDELGMGPLISLDSIFVVNGRPALYARTMVGLLISEGGELERIEATSERVVVRARLNRSREWQEFEWDMDRAKRAGYTSNKKYQSNPIEMLYAKASTEAVRVVAPHLLAGMPVVEEVQLGDVEDMGETAPGQKQVTEKPKSKPRATTKRTVKKPQPEPEQEQEDEGEKDEPTPEKVTSDQLTRIADRFKGMGITGREEILNAVADIVGRELAASSDLTYDEAEHVLSEME